MTAPLRDLPPWLATILPGLRGGPIAVAEYPALVAATVTTTPAIQFPTSTASTLFSGASTPHFRRTLSDLIPSIPMTGGVLQVPSLAVTGGAAPHLETIAKVEAAMVFAGAIRKAGTVATWVGVTDELLDDTPGLAAWLDLYLSQLVKGSEERVILTGNGVTTPIVGFFDPASGVPTYAGSMTDDVELVADMIGQAASTSGIVPDTVVVSGSIWAGLVKGGAGGAGALDADAQTFAGCAVVVSPALTETQILVGPCQSLAVVGREGGILVEGTSSHATDFVVNKSAIRAASRIALGILMPTAFVKKA